MADSSGFGMIKVDAAVLKSKAEDAYVKIQNYREAVEQIAATVSASSGYWEGQAGNLYRDIMRLQVKAIENTLTEYANYPKELLEYAGIYSSTISQTNAKAEEIESVDMF
jgi:uncharacterized protein YukE